MISTNFIRHVLVQGFSPAEISDFDPQVHVQKYIQAFQVSVQDGRSTRVQIVNPLGYFDGEPFSLLPRNLVLLVLQERPQGTSTAIFQNNTIVLGLRHCPQKHHNIRVPHSLHRIALAQEIPQAHVPVFYFEFLHHHQNLPPLRLINYPIPSLIDSLYYFQLTPIYLHVRPKLPVFGHPIDIELRESLCFLAHFFGRLVFLKQS